METPTQELNQLILPTEVKFADDVEDTRTITFIASTDSEDRHGTVVNQAGWELDNFNTNPIIGYQHNVYGAGMCNAPDPDDVIGTGRAYLEDVATKGSDKKQQRLMVDIQFEPKDINEKAEKIFRKVMHGSLKAVSVGFMEKGKGTFGREGDDGEIEHENTYFFSRQELLEVSVVNIPANADAVRKSLRDQTASALLYIKRELGLPFSTIEQMTVEAVCEALKNPVAFESSMEVTGILGKDHREADGIKYSIDYLDSGHINVYSEGELMYEFTTETTEKDAKSPLGKTELSTKKDALGNIIYKHKEEKANKSLDNKKKLLSLLEQY